MSEAGRERHDDDAGQGAVLWRPTPDERENSPLGAFAAWLAERGHRFDDYGSLWRWSTDEIEEFWGAVWEYFDVGTRDAKVVLPWRTWSSSSGSGSR